MGSERWERDDVRETSGTHAPLRSIKYIQLASYLLLLYFYASTTVPGSVFQKVTAQLKKKCLGLAV